jgi:hypothetical protein
MSGGTLIALAADEIAMCSHSVLGPIDPQLGQSPAASLIKVVEEKSIARIDDQTLILPGARRLTRSSKPQASSSSAGSPSARSRKTPVRSFQVRIAILITSSSQFDDYCRVGGECNTSVRP